ncbi:hypothetical protein CRUP_017626 [Coryphaenoides rupestris]|nr:hypothetical protein CRUP_017626 [Coryphaenoides rupestris]
MEASIEAVSKYIQQSDGEAEHDGSMCSYCDGVMDKDVRIFMSCPPMVCHQACLTCAVCACALGDMLIPMYLRGQKIYCGSCYFKTI